MDESSKPTPRIKSAWEDGPEYARLCRLMALWFEKKKVFELQAEHSWALALVFERWPWDDPELKNKRTIEDRHKTILRFAELREHAKLNGAGDEELEG